MYAIHLHVRGKPCEKKRILKLTAKLQAQPTQPKNALSSGLVLVSLGRLGWGRLVWFGEQVPIGHELLPILGVGTLVFLLMLGCVMAVVHHADQLADMLREPYGTLVLTLSVTVIEVSLMLRVMLQGAENPTLLRDTVFVVLMITMNGMVGLALTAGGWRHVEQSFNLHGAIAYVQLIAPLYLLLLIMPNYTISFDGPTLVPLQETYLGALCLAVYMLFLLIQTRRHRSYFEHTDVAYHP